MQQKILNVLESKTNDIRLIAGNNDGLETRVKEGLFNKELCHKLKLLSIAIAPLRNRREDIDMLTEKFSQKFSAMEGKSIVGLTDKAKHLLHEYFWPGNVRELQNIMFRAVAICQNDYVDEGDFFNKIPKPDSNNDNITRSYSITNLCLTDDNGRVKKLHDIEGEVIRMTLEKCEWHISEAARKLGIGRSTLYRKMDELGIRSREKQVSQGQTQVA